MNKKAFEQYNNFTKQRDQLLQRREDLDKSAQSIQELVEVLDQRKDEAIERTFKQVASNFEEVFEKLVPAGRGRLIIQRRVDQVSFHFLITFPHTILTRGCEQDEEEADDVEETQQSTIDNYTGVSIKVFGSLLRQPTFIDTSAGLFQLQSRRRSPDPTIVRWTKVIGGSGNRFVSFVLLCNELFLIAT